MQTFSPVRALRALNSVERKLDLAIRQSQSLPTFAERRHARRQRDRLMRSYKTLQARLGDR